MQRGCAVFETAVCGVQRRPQKPRDGSADDMQRSDVGPSVGTSTERLLSRSVAEPHGMRRFTVSPACCCAALTLRTTSTCRSSSTAEMSRISR